MKNKLILFATLFVVFSISNVYGQFVVGNEFSFDYLNERWQDYQKDRQHDMLNFSRLYFRDTISVNEMKESFYKYKDTRFVKSPFAGLDSVERMGAVGESVLLMSPLKNHPSRKVRECRGVWNYFFHLTDLLDKNGVSQEALKKKVKVEEMKKCLNGEFVTLRAPHWYMGFVVSPIASMNVYSNGKSLVHTPTVFSSDFFAYAQRYNMVLDGEWYHRVNGGARLLGSMIGLNTMVQADVPETEFSVLLYAKTYPRSNKITYTIDLLLPENPTKETIALFNEMKRFVEGLPSNTFSPYYTTDMRLMIGRYYKVTVNKCGWLIEDYLK